MLNTEVLMLLMTVSLVSQRGQVLSSSPFPGILTGFKVAAEVVIKCTTRTWSNMVHQNVMGCSIGQDLSETLAI